METLDRFLKCSSRRHHLSVKAVKRVPEAERGMLTNLSLGGGGGGGGAGGGGGGQWPGCLP